MRLLTRLLPVVLLFTACGWGAKRFSAPPSVSQALSITLNSASASSGELDARLTVVNQLDQEVVMDRNQIALVTPEGEYYRAGDNGVFLLKPKESSPLRLVVRAGKGELRKSPGVYLRFDGFYAGGRRVDVPPMPLGQPEHPAGQPNPNFAGPSSTPPRDKSLFRSAAQRFGVLMDPADSGSGSSGSGSGSGTAPQGQPTVVTYEGPRQKLKTLNVKCAAMPFEALSVKKEVAKVMDEILLGELQEVGFESISPEDINAMLGFEKTKEAAGCDSSTCIAEIGGALGVEYLVAGKLASLDGSPAVTLKLIDVKNTKVLARSSKIGAEDKRDIPKLIAEAVQDLVRLSKL